MPHKRNPMLCEATVALARLVMNGVPSALDGMIQKHERDMGPWQMEWAYLPEMCIMTDGALHLTVRVLRGLRVNPGRMLKNLEQLEGLMLSEAVMLALAQKVGRQTAHDVVHACAMRAVEEARPFRATLAEHPRVAQHLSTEEIERLLDPRRYTGLAGQFVDRVVEKVRNPPYSDKGEKSSLETSPTLSLHASKLRVEVPARDVPHPLPPCYGLKEKSPLTPLSARRGATCLEPKGPSTRFLAP